MSGEGRYGSYPQLTDSEQVWLGAIPDQWATLRNKYAASYAKGRNPKNLHVDDGEGLVPYLSMGYLRGQSEAQYASVEPGCMLAEPNQILVIWDGSNAGEFVRARAGLLSSTMAMANVSRAYHAGYYWFVCKALEPELRRTAVGMGIPHVDGDELRCALLPHPPLEEQTQIAKFLDYETAKIDALIEKQQQLIALLKEKRQAVISHAVTKGLNPDAPMRDSGVKWLGEVPAHWKLSQLKYLVKPGTSITYGIVQAGPHIEDGIPYIKTSDMSGDELPKSGYSRTSVAIDEAYRRSRVFPGDIVISIRASVGKCLPVPDELSAANLTQGTAKISPGPNLLRDFLLAYLSAAPVQDYLMSIAKGATFKEITLDMLRRVPIVAPPLSEQALIANRVRTSIERFSDLSNAAALQAELLKERRTALISAAVTGKIDVRGWKAPEPAGEAEVA